MAVKDPVENLKDASGAEMLIYVAGATIFVALVGLAANEVVF